MVDVLDAEEPPDGVAVTDDRVLAAVSGETRATGRAADDGAGADAPESAHHRRQVLRRRARAVRPPRDRRRVTWRVVLFVVAVAAVIGVVFGAVNYYGRHTYYVGFDQNEVVIFKGRPGGVLWIHPRRSSAPS